MTPEKGTVLLQMTTQGNPLAVYQIDDQRYTVGDSKGNPNGRANDRNAKLRKTRRRIRVTDLNILNEETTPDWQGNSCIDD